MFRRVVPAILLAIAMVIGFAAPAGADNRPTDPMPGTVVWSADADSAALGVGALRSQLAQAAAEGRTEVSHPIADSTGSRVVFRYEPGGQQAGGGEVSPQFTVGLGWRVYIYMNRGDWLYLAGLGAAGASAALCWWLTPTLGGAVACAIASYIVVTFLLNWSAPPSGYCREFRFTYGGGYDGTKLVRRGC